MYPFDYRLLLLSLLSVFFVADSPVIIEHKKGLDNILVKSIPTLNNGIISVGYAENYYNDNQQIYLTKYDTETERRTIHTVIEKKNADATPIDIVEDVFGNILILCTSKNEQGVMYNWLDVREANGSNTRRVDLNQEYKPTSLTTEKNSVQIYYNAGNGIYKETYDGAYDLSNSTLVELPINGTLKNYNLLETEDGIKGISTIESEGIDAFLFSLKDTSLDLLPIPQSNAVDVGGIDIHDNGNLYFTLLIDNGRTREDVVFGKVNNVFDSKSEIQLRTLEKGGSDIPISVSAVDSEIFIINNSDSHKRGASTTKIQIYTSDLQGTSISDPTYANVNKYTEFAASSFVTNDNLVISGSVNNPTVFKSDIDYLLYNIPLSAKSKPKQIIKASLIKVSATVKPINEANRSEFIEGDNCSLQFTVYNEGEEKLDDISISIGELESQVFKVAPGMKKEITLPIGQLKDDYIFEYVINQNGTQLYNDKDFISVDRLLDTEVTIESININTKDAELVSGEEYILEIKCKVKNRKDHDKIGVLVNSYQIKQSSANNAKNDSYKNLEIFEVPIRIKDKPFLDQLDMKVNCFLNEEIVDIRDYDYTIEMPSLVIDETPLDEEQEIQLINEVADEVFTQQIELNYVMISDQELQPDNLYVSVDGIENSIKGGKTNTPEIVASEVDENGKYNYTIRYMADLAPGDNSISVGCKIDDNTDIQSQTKDVNFVNIDNGNMYVVSVGISDKYTFQRLSYTQQDAKDFAELMKEQEGRFFQYVDVTTLTEDLQTTRSGILNALVPLKQRGKAGLLREQDVIVFFISTHGIPEHNDSHLLTCVDYLAGNESNTTLDFIKDIYKEFESIPGKKLYLIDACHSGIINDNLMSRKGITDNDINYKGALEALLKTKNASNVLLSCGPDEYSYENAKWGNSAFIETFVKLLSNPELCKSLDKNNDYVVSLGELEYALRLETDKLVKETLGKTQSQVPMFLMDESQMDIPFFAY